MRKKLSKYLTKCHGEVWLMLKQKIESMKLKEFMFINLTIKKKSVNVQKTSSSMIRRNNNVYNGIGIDL